MAQTLIDINGDVRDAASLTVPKDRTFRDAWQFNGSAAEVDMVKARDIHRENLRRDREALLKDLDVEFMLALERGDDTSAIVAKKHALRDVTKDPKIEAADTPTKLKNLTLAKLIGT